MLLPLPLAINIEEKYGDLLSDNNSKRELLIKVANEKLVSIVLSF